MAMLKYASVKIEKVGSLEEVLWDGVNRERTMVRVASLLPVSRVLDDYIYLRSWAVSAGEVYGANDNLDFFPKEELLKSYATFINTGFYKDHANYDVKLAYGLNLDSVFTQKDFVAVISAIKKAGLQPDQEDLVRRIKSGEVDQVSMGCQVETSTCSNCGNVATHVGQYCECLKNARMMRTAVLSGMCPECGPREVCTHIREARRLGITMDKSANSSSIKGKPLYEINRGCTFFDLSAITTVAADRNARIAEVIDKEASVTSETDGDGGLNTVLDFIRPSEKLSCVKADGACRCQEVKSVSITGGEKMAANLSKESDKNPDLKNQVEGGNPQEMTEAGDYPQKAGKPEDLAVKRDKADSAAPKKEHEIRERAQHDAGDYGPGGGGEKLQEVDSHDLHKKEPVKDVEKYQADAAKGVKGLGKEAADNAGFITELKGFFQGLMRQAAEEKTEEPKVEEPKVEEPVKPVEMDMGGIEEIRASLRDDLESLQEACDKLHDEKLQMLAKASTAVIPVIQKRAKAELAALHKLDEEVLAAKHMVEEALAEMKAGLEGKASKGGVDSSSVAEYKKAAGEVRSEVDKVLDKVVEAVAGKAAAGGKPEMAPSSEMGPEAKAVPEVGAGAMKSKMCPVHKEKCPPECPMSMGASKTAAKPEDARQKMTDAGDYDRPQDPYKAQAKKNESQGKETQGDIEKQKSTPLTGKPEDWMAYRKLNALTKKLVSEGKSLKEAKEMAFSELSKKAVDAKKQAAMQKVSDELGTDDLKAQIVDRVSDKLVTEIFESDPSHPKNVAAAESIKAGGADDTKGVFTPDVKPTAVAKKAAADEGGKETYPGDKAIAKDTEKEPSDPYWDLFPEDNITSAVGEANKEMGARSKETMREVTASSVNEQVPFSNNQAYEKQASTDSLLGADSLTRILEAISLADKEVEAGLVDEAQLEEEAKRLFVSSPDELRATSKVIAKVAKRTFKSPVPDGYMKQAVSMGDGSSDSKDEFSLFDNGEEGLY